MIKRIFKFFGKILLWFFAMSIIWVALLKFIPVYITPLMVIRYFENNEQNKWTHKWVTLKDISKNLQLAVICSEDQKFVYHNGFDTEAIEKAYEANQKGKNYAVQAPFLSKQLKMSFYGHNEVGREKDSRFISRF